MRFFQDFRLPLFFKKYLCKIQLGTCLTDFPFEEGAKTNPVSDWVVPCCSLGCCHIPTWDTHCMFTTCFSGHLHWAWAETMSSILAGKSNPARSDGERLVVVGHKGSAGEETNQQNLGITNHFWCTYLNRSLSDIEQSKKGDR